MDVEAQEDKCETITEIITIRSEETGDQRAKASLSTLLLAMVVALEVAEAVLEARATRGPHRIMSQGQVRRVEEEGRLHRIAALPHTIAIPLMITDMILAGKETTGMVAAIDVVIAMTIITEKAIEIEIIMTRPVQDTNAPATTMNGGTPWNLWLMSLAVTSLLQKSPSYPTTDTRNQATCNINATDAKPSLCPYFLHTVHVYSRIV